VGVEEATGADVIVFVAVGVAVRGPGALAIASAPRQ